MNHEESNAVISVIVPAYNRKDLTTRAVRSLLAQEGAGRFEVLVVDDGSTDGTADALVGLDPRVRVVRQENRGASAARHAGVLAAKGDLVAFLDSDDIATSDHLARLREGLFRRPDVVLSYARVGKIDGGSFSDEHLPGGLDEDAVLNDPLVGLLEVGCFTTSMVLMTSREIALASSLGRGHVLASNDYDFSLRAATRGPFAFVDRRTIRCDRQPDGISTSRSALQAGFAVIAACEAVSLSRRSDPEVWRALGRRIEMIWPSAFVKLARAGRPTLGLRVAAAGLRHARWIPSLRRLWWAMDHEYRASTRGQPAIAAHAKS